MTNDADRNAITGRNIAELRKARGLTQAELAEAVDELGVPFRQQTIVKLEKGQRALSYHEARRLAMALDVNTDDFDREPIVVDDMVLLASDERRVDELEAHVRQSVQDLHEAKLILAWRLENLGRRPEIGQAVLDSAFTRIQVDPVKVAEAAVAEYHAENAIVNARALASPMRRTFDRSLVHKDRP